MFFRSIYLFAKSLRRIAVVLEELAALYRMELASRGLILLDTKVKDQVEVQYGYSEPEEQ